MTATAPPTASPGIQWLTAGLAASLGVAGLVHCILMPDHLADSTIIGLGFLAAATAQLGLAALVLLRPSRLVYGAIIGVSIVLMGLYAYNVFVGLPFHASDVAAEGGHDDEEAPAEESGEQHETEHGPAEAGHGEQGLALGAGEPVDGWGAVTQVAQLACIGFAVTLLRRPRTASAGTGC